MTSIDRKSRVTDSKVLDVDLAKHIARVIVIAKLLKTITGTVLSKNMIKTTIIVT